MVAYCAGCALIARLKSFGGLPYNVNRKLYYSCDVLVITYTSTMRATHFFTCVNAVHHGATTFFLGTDKCTPNVAVQGDIGWNPIIIDQLKSVCNHWHRC
jgi:hypothetical protein